MSITKLFLRKSTVNSTTQSTSQPVVAPITPSPELARVPFIAGVHGPDTALVGDKEVRPYIAGSLQKYLQALGVLNANGEHPAPARGAIAHVKIRDEASRWRRGRAPEIAPSVKTFLRDAKALGFRTVVAWIPHGSWVPASFGTAMPAEADRLRDAAKAMARTLDTVDAWIYGNEPEALLAGAASSRDWSAYWAAEAMAGMAWRSVGKAWIAGADMSAAHLVDTMPSRMAAWRAVTGSASELPEAIAAHMYGEGGDQPEHLEVLKRALRAKLGYTPHVILTEWAIGFEGTNVERGSKTYVHDVRAGDYAASFSREMAVQEIAGCYFTLRELTPTDEKQGAPEPVRGLQRAIWLPAPVAPAPILNPSKAMAKGMRLEREAREIGA